MFHYNYFEYEYYITKYKDLSKMNKEQAINHFKNYGIKEKRKFNELLENFDYTFYVTKYKDLSKMNYLEACNHYINNGRIEGIKCTILKQNDNNKLNINNIGNTIITISDFKSINIENNNSFSYLMNNLNGDNINESNFIKNIIKKGITLYFNNKFISGNNQLKPEITISRNKSYKL